MKEQKKPYIGDYKYAVKYRKSYLRRSEEEPPLDPPKKRATRNLYAPPSPIPNPLLENKYNEYYPEYFEYRSIQPSYPEVDYSGPDVVTRMANSLLKDYEKHRGKSKKRTKTRLRNLVPDLELPRLAQPRLEPKRGKEPKSQASSRPITIPPMVLVCAGLALTLLVLLGVVFYQRNAILLAEHSKAKYIKRPKIAVFHQPSHKEDPFKELERDYNAEIIHVNTKSMKTRQEYLKALRKYSFHVLVTNNGLIGSLDNDMIQYLPQECVAIISSNLRYNASSINSLTDRNVQLSHNINTELKINSTADTHVFLMLSAMRNYQQSILNLLKLMEENLEYESFWRTKPWLFDWPPYPVETVYEQSGQADSGVLPNGKRLGIIGMNGVGKAIAMRVKNFNFKSMVYYSEFQLPGSVEEALGLEYVSLDELITTSDVISINIMDDFFTKEKEMARNDGSDRNYHEMFNDNLIGRMKDGVILVNTASEKLLNYNLIKKYAGNGKIRAVAMDSLDFFDKDLALKVLKMPNVIVTPQTNLYTDEVIHGDDSWVVENIKHLLETGRVQNIVPEQRFIDFRFDYFRK